MELQQALKAMKDQCAVHRVRWCSASRFVALAFSAVLLAWPRCFLEPRLPSRGLKAERMSLRLHQVHALGEADATSPCDELHILRVIRLDGSETVFKTAPSADLSNGWQLTDALLAQEEGGTEFDYYGGEYGHTARAILGDENAADGSWFWALYVYGSFTQEWLRAPGSLDSVDLDTFPHLAWVAVKTAATEKQLEEERIMRLLGPSPLRQS